MDDLMSVKASLFLQKLGLDLNADEFDIVYYSIECDTWSNIFEPLFIVKTAQVLVNSWKAVKEQDYNAIWQAIKKRDGFGSICSTQIVWELLQLVPIQSVQSYIGLEECNHTNLNDYTVIDRLWPIMSKSKETLFAFIDSDLMKDQSLTSVIYNQIINMEYKLLEATLSRAGKTHPTFSWDEVDDDRYVMAILHWAQSEYIDASDSEQTRRCMVCHGFTLDKLESVIRSAYAVDPDSICYLLKLWNS